MLIRKNQLLVLLAVFACASVYAQTKPSLEKAKTVAQLLELDDKIAIAKDEAALIKERESIPKALPIPSDVKISATKKKAAPFVPPESEVHVTGILGLDGARVISLKVGEKDIQIDESAVGAVVSGFKVTRILGSCVTLGKDGATPKNVCYSGNRAQTVAPLPITPLPAFSSAGSALPVPPIPQTMSRK